MRFLTSLLYTMLGLVLLTACASKDNTLFSLGTVTTPDGSVYGQSMRVRITGNALAGKVFATLKTASGANACTSFTATTTTDTLVEYTCAPLTQLGELTLKVTRADGELLLTQTITSGFSNSAISSIVAPDGLHVLAANTLEVTGTNLSDLLELKVKQVDSINPESSVDACSSLTVTSKSATKYVYTCVPKLAGEVVATLATATGVTLKDATFTVLSDASITAINVPTTVKTGDTITIKVQGKNLPSTNLTLTALLASNSSTKACATLTSLTATNTEHSYTCAVSATAPFVLTASNPTLGLNQTLTVTPVVEFTVSNIALKDNAGSSSTRKATFVMQGTSLSAALLPTSDQCTSISYVSGTSTNSEYTCITSATKPVITFTLNGYTKSLAAPLPSTSVAAVNYYGLSYGSTSAIKITDDVLTQLSNADDVTVELQGCKTAQAPLSYTHPAKYEKVFSCDQVTATDKVAVTVKHKNGDTMLVADVAVNAKSVVGSATTATPSVSAVSYSKGLFTIDGANLNQAISVSMDGCLSFDVASRTSSRLSLRCARLIKVGNLDITVSGSSGVLKTDTLTIPQPQLTLTLNQDNNSTLGVVTVVMAMDVAKAPLSANNILYYVWNKAYVSTILHRVAANSFVQAGAVKKGTTADITATYPTIKLERTSVTGLSNTVGTVAMARTSAVDSGGQSFFFNTGNNTATYDSTADGNGYATFAKVLVGLDKLQLLDDTAATSLKPTNDINLLTIEQTQ